MNPEYVLILVTSANTAEAEQISRALVEKKLIACSSIISPISSFFCWKGKACHESEVLLMMKSVRTLVQAVVVEVKKVHSYETPEIIAIPIIDGSDDYLQWITKETKTINGIDNFR